jgi:hypothetical protein
MKTTLLKKRREALDAYAHFLTTGERPDEEDEAKKPKAKPKSKAKSDNVVPFTTKAIAGGAK